MLRTPAYIFAAPMGKLCGIGPVHVTPKSRGGRDVWENLVAACVPCNNRKGNHTPEEARMTLRRKPFRPSYVMFIRDFVEQMDDRWKPYLFLA